MNCGGCKHWDRAERPPNAPEMLREDQDGREVYTQSGYGPLPGVWGTCERILHLSSDSRGRPADLDESTAGDPAYLADGSGYFASLTTRGDFGCTLFESQVTE